MYTSESQVAVGAEVFVGELWLRPNIKLLLILRHEGRL